MALAKNVRVTPEFREQLRDFAWRKRLSMSVVVGDAITEYAKGEFSMPPREVIEDGTVLVKYGEPELYQKAVERAKKEGYALQDVIRFRLAMKFASDIE